MAKSTYYYHLKRLQEKDKYEPLREQISAVYVQSKCTYGYRRITLSLKASNINVNHKTVRKQMKQMGIKAIQKAKKYHSYKGTVGVVAPNIIHRDFKATEPCKKWTTDISQISIGEKKLFLSVLLDMFNGEILSYKLSEHPNLKIVTDTIRTAFKNVHQLHLPLIIHSDQGWHYQHCTYRNILIKNSITQSMSRKSNCYDNAIMESFFGIMKSKFLYLNKFKTIESFKTAFRKYITFYNNKRIKLKFKMSPVQYKNKFYQQLNY